jgi:SAM-dependent methyltransferase
VRMMAERVAPGGRAIGIDLSAEMVARARERAAGVDAVEYRVGSVTALPFDDASVDAAYSERVFMHLADPQAAMHELFRILRPGGRLVVIDPDHTRAATDANDVALADLLVDRLTARIMNPRAGPHLRSQAVLAGFEVIRIEAFTRVFTDRNELPASSRFRPNSASPSWSLRASSHRSGPTRTGWSRTRARARAVSRRRSGRTSSSPSDHRIDQRAGNGADGPGIVIG